MTDPGYARPYKVVGSAHGHVRGARSGQHNTADTCTAAHHIPYEGSYHGNRAHETWTLSVNSCQMPTQCTIWSAVQSMH